MRALHIGSAMIDVICIVAAENIERMTFSNDAKSFLMVEAGRKVPAESITTHVGGGACNTAVSLARRGWDTAVLARIGADHNAEAVRSHLDANGIRTDWLVTAPEAATGSSVMVASHDRNASIFVHRGANQQLSPDLMADGVFDSWDLVYIAPLSSNSADGFPRIVSRAKAAGAMVAVNAGIRHITSRTAAFLDALRHVDLLAVNRVEAEALVPAIAARAEGPDPLPAPDAPALIRTGLSGGGFGIGLVRFMEELRKAGPTWVLLTDGTEGAWLAGPDGVIWRPSLPVKVAGTAGAGDSYASTLTAALAEGLPAPRAMLEAAANAASVVSVVDTTDGLLTRAALDARIAELGEVALFRA